MIYLAPMVRALGAIHLATALDLQASTIELVTYDRRLAAVVREAGLAVVSPA